MLKKYIITIKEEATIEYKANSPSEALSNFDEEIYNHQEYLEEYGEFSVSIEPK